MTRTLGTLLCLVMLATPALAKKKKGGGGAPPPPADSGGGMTFEPETVERKDADPTPPPTATKKPSAVTKKPPAFVGEPPKAGQATKTLERALKLYDAD